MERSRVSLVLRLASRLGAGVPNSGLSYELDVIAAVVVGGTSLMGGSGSVAGTFWGTVFIGILNNWFESCQRRSVLTEGCVGRGDSVSSSVRSDKE
jgi:ribose/xylose/arabinose/galactoside ABC-type transport system permease subunit